MGELIDRDHVAEVLRANPEGALEELEAEGYRVVRAGMVPRLDALDEVERMLDRLGGILGAIHDSRKTGEAAWQIQQLRKLALLVLGIDRDDVDEVTG